MNQRPNRTDFFWFGLVRFDLIFLKSGSSSVRFACLFKIKFGSVRSDLIFKKSVRVRFASSAFLKRSVRVRFGSSATSKIGSGSVRFGSTQISIT